MEMKNSVRSRTWNTSMNLITGLGGQLLVVLFNFISRTVFIKTLGSDYLGINGLFSDILKMLSLTELGIDTAVNFRLYKPLADHDEKRIRLLMKFYKRAYIVVGLVIFAGGLLLLPFLPYLVKDYYKFEQLNINAVFVFIIYLAQSTSSYLFFAARTSIVKADQKWYLINIVDYAVTVIVNIIQIIILVLLRDFIIYTVISAAGVILQSFLNAIVSTKMYPYAFEKDKDNISKSEITDIFKDIASLFVFKVNTVILKASDNLVLSIFIGLEIVGLYSNYLMFYLTITTLLQRVYDSVRASTGNLFANSSDDEKRKFFETMNFISILLYGTACVGIALEVDEFIACWIGSGFIIAQPFAILIGVEILFAGLKKNLNQIRNVSGVFKQMWYRPLIGIILNLVVSIVLVRIIGIYGVIIGTISADVLTNFMLDPFVIYKYSLNGHGSAKDYYVRNFLYFIVLTVVLVLDYFVCQNFITGFGWLSVIVHAIICGISVPIALCIVFHKTREYRYLKSIVMKGFKQLFCKG